MTRKALLFAALTLVACEPRQPAAPASPPPAPTPAPAPAPAPARPPAQATDNWRDYARPADADRLARLSGAWETALKLARDKGHADELAALGPLTDPKAAVLPHPQPAPGDYRCRTIKLGGNLGFVSYPWFKCRVELTPGGDLTLTKTTGSQRPAGKFYPDADTRLVYLGGQAWGSDEEKAPAYGAAPERDQIGVLERIGETRWRLALPWPRVESDLDLMELRR
jgi:hypothetical protein